ncbi:hypothetical protein NP603_05090 [Methylomonas sp. SURF-1]|uniref:Uncharacterized protein n=1 Tax=Methylomonas aurea TaxID=2952224 RepID=A0ABT1UE12_9GAMM|nr:hypothetical protein [Methylomonas sp. SURF-1]MCQ8180473.1 hypothetical protein [Methylomonas sp. SURF-1]
MSKVHFQVTDVDVRASAVPVSSTQSRQTKQQCQWQMSSQKQA